MAQVALPVDGKTLPEAYLRQIKTNGTKPFCKIKKSGNYVPITWDENHTVILGLTQGFKKLGLKKGDKVSIMSGSRPEWVSTDLATQCFGGVTVPIYPSTLAEDVAYILDNCEAKCLFVEDETQLEKAFVALKSLGRNIPIISYNPNPKSRENFQVQGFTEFALLHDHGNAHSDLEKLVQSVQPSEPATIVYTSGTTGVPKGAVLTHSNLADTLRIFVKFGHITGDDSLLSFLPFSHIMGRLESLVPVLSGTVLAFAESIAEIGKNIQEIRPTLIVSVPRVFEKIYAKIQSQVESSPKFKRDLFWWAVDIGREAARLRAQKKSIPIKLALKEQVAKGLVLNKVRDKLGGRIRIALSGGAPLSPTLCEFFHACGILVLEGYGLTETTGPVVINAPEDYEFGTVGKPLEGGEIKIAQDGEILLRGPMIFKGYYRNPQATAEALSPDGWFSTGDIGEITERGSLKITDRKKELIVTAGGKNVAPQKIENMLKNARYISNCMVFGDKEKYLTALVTVDPDELSLSAKEDGVQWNNFEELLLNDKALALIQTQIDDVNAHLASFETIKKFRIVPQDFSIESGELTPSMKIKRKVITKKYENLIREMY